MRFEYVCRYCRQKIGAVENPRWSLGDAMERLGLHHLDPDHQQDVIRPREDQIEIQTVCDTCEQAVARHPELLLEGSIIQ
ncbi:anti-sigma-F factor Fin [Alicyclobacillus vulcanalis]|uniref:Anti-sigma-F factor Fin n=1 Tax=Alicyclobacillus vulcanalis TaxID=252246 RepID=A0A1N7MIT1_9BACL|nr:anti-sigma-F factor Fin [Alicyclobacillus vulcanalis]SIS85950.1 Protein of unknown function [Alicyclobacillus vulcanalis]